MRYNLTKQRNFNITIKNSYDFFLKFIIDKSMWVIIILSILLYLPMLLVNGDLWDGVIIQNAIRVEKPEVYHEWFLEAGLFLTPFIYDFLSFFGSERYGFSARLVSLIFLSLSAHQIYLISRTVFGVDNRVAICAAIYFLISPVWALYYSSIYVLHSMTLFFALLSAHLFTKKSFASLAFLLAAMSFQQSSNVVLIISILFIFVAIKRVYNKEVVYYIFISVLIAILFFGLRYSFPTFGLYHNYNAIDLFSLFNFGGWLRFVREFIKINLFIIIPCLATLVVILFYRKWHLNLLFFVLIGVAMNFSPYIAVGKFPDASEIGISHGNSLRFMFTATVFAAFLIPALWLSISSLRKSSQIQHGFSFLSNKLNIFNYGIKKNQGGKAFSFDVYLIVYIILVSFFSLYFFAISQKGKIQEFAFQEGLSSELRKFSEASECVVNIISNGVAYLTIYEYGDIFYKAFGENESLILANSNNIQKDANSFIDLQKSETYRIKYFLPSRVPNCQLTLQIDADFSSSSLMDVYYSIFYPISFPSGRIILHRH